MPVGNSESYEPYQLQQPEWQGAVGQGIAPQQGRIRMDQIDWLLKRLSPEDKLDLMQASRQCFYNTTLTRAVPFSIAVTASLYYARSRLPESMRFGPKGWTFYAMTGFASLVAANVLFAGKCNDALRPKLEGLYQKYLMEAPNTASYDKIREAHRRSMSGSSSLGVYEYSPQSGREYDANDQLQAEENSAKRNTPRVIDFSRNEPTFISGTPYQQEPNELNDPYIQHDSGDNARRGNKSDFGGVEFS